MFSLIRVTGLVVLMDSLLSCEAVKQQDFKTCSQSTFCQRNREFADNASASGAQWVSTYSLDESSLSLEAGIFKGIVTNQVSGQSIEFPLQISFLKSGVARVQIDEKRRRIGDVPIERVRKERYNEAEQWVIVDGLELDKSVLTKKTPKGITKIAYAGGIQELVITHKPLKLEFYRKGELEIVLNGRGLLNIEHWRPKPEESEPSKGEWSETWKDKIDSKPRGPESIALDVSFNAYSHVYGIPEHASSLSLKETRGGPGNYDEPYRLYNLDVFEYEVDRPMALYGSIPFMQAHKKGSDVGIFWLNAAETWIDITKTRSSPSSFSNIKSTHTHWISESGILDVFIFLGPDAPTIYKQMGQLTGYTALPRAFAIAYHQCRWNYNNEDDVKQVNDNFDSYQIPYDVIWLDIEHTDDKKYFTWDKDNFPTPEKMLTELDRLVTIIDPHIKRDPSYYVYDEFLKADLYIKDRDGNDFSGWCWPGHSMWIDFFNPKAYELWQSMFTFEKYRGSKENLFVWNDMNEPSVFDGPEVTLFKDTLHYNGWEHRDVHNLYGMLFHNATAQGVAHRTPKPLRPFVLSRAFYAGSQRIGAIWTGDNTAEWSHLEIATPMLLSNGIAGMAFSGGVKNLCYIPMTLADVGGFFGDTEATLMVRWYQAGAFYPFFRAHAHLDSLRREPWKFGEPYTTLIRNAIRLRYQLLPMWYTAFHEASVNGMPILRPQFVIFPDDTAGFDIDTQFYVGNSGLLVRPVTTKGATNADVYFSDDEPYYDYFDYTLYKGRGYKNIEASLEKIPLFIRGGHIVTRRDRLRRSSELMKNDPFTFVIALDNNGNASGSLYYDDGESYEYKSGAYMLRGFTFSSKDKKFISRELHPSPLKAKDYLHSIEHLRIEKIIILGVDEKLSNKVKISQNGKFWESESLFNRGQNSKTNILTLRNPGVSISKDFVIDL